MAAARSSEIKRKRQDEPVGARYAPVGRSTLIDLNVRSVGFNDSEAGVASIREVTLGRRRQCAISHVHHEERLRAPDQFKTVRTIHHLFKIGRQLRHQVEYMRAMLDYDAGMIMLGKSFYPADRRERIGAINVPGWHQAVIVVDLKMRDITA